METVQPQFGIAGSGRIACALGRLLLDRGNGPAIVAARDAGRASVAASFIGAAEIVPLEDLAGRAKRIVVAVSDDAIHEVAGRIAVSCRPGTVVLHASGVHGIDVLEPISRAGGHCGALHPLATVPSPEKGLRTIPGAPFAFTGPAEARVWAVEIVETLGGELIDLPAEGRGLYHAAAVLACNSIPGLLEAASELLVYAGAAHTSDAALRMLAPIVLSSVENTFALGPLAALTGPARRGDVSTLRTHLTAIESSRPAIGRLYRAQSLWLVELARRAGLEPAKAQIIEEALTNE